MELHMRSAIVGAAVLVIAVAVSDQLDQAITKPRYRTTLLGRRWVDNSSERV